MSPITRIVSALVLSTVTASAALAEPGEKLGTVSFVNWALEVEVQQLGAEAWVAYAKGDRDHAVAQMRAPADKEDLGEKSSVSPGRLVPASELLGDLLMASGRPVDALAECEASLARDPRRRKRVAQAGDAQFIK